MEDRTCCVSACDGLEHSVGSTCPAVAFAANTTLTVVGELVLQVVHSHLVLRHSANPVTLVLSRL